MKLNDRKKNILATIVETFIQTGEPVSSKLLATRLNFRVSPATIRSDMAWLFEMGYLEQPHTSSGRVPSHLGYREYINSLMHLRPLTKEEKDEIDSLFNIKNPDPDKLLEDAAGALSDYTKCATVTSSITPKTVRLRQVELIAAGINTVVVIVIASNGVIRNKVCRVDFVVSQEIIEFFNKFANSRLAGMNIDVMSSSYMNSISITLGEYSKVFTPILAAIFELCKEINDGQYYLSGGVNLLEYNELNILARDILAMLERRDKLQALFSIDGEDTKVIIGKENHSMELADSAVVMTHYNVGGERAGTVGIIGPVRIDYAKIIPHLDYFAKTLGELLTDTFQGQ